MKNVYGYVRVSTQKQGEGVSLIVQTEAITRYAAQYNLNIIQWFEEKETAAKQGRPLFSQMMKLIKDKKADGVVMHKIDRSARNLKDWADLGNLIDQGVDVHFAHESLDLQARGGRLSADIQAVIAADYIRNLRQEAIKGLYGRLNQGIYPFHAPAGYINTGKGKHKTIDPVHGALVRKAFELYATRKYTLRELCKITQSLGLKTRKSQKLSVTGLSTILNNPFYMGILRVKGKHFKGGHERLITPQLFKQVQHILNKNTNQKVLKHSFVFRKLITCKHCGYSLVGEMQKGNTYYRCHTKGCPTKSIREKFLHRQVSEMLRTAELLSEESATLNTLLHEMESEWTTKQDELLLAVNFEGRKVDDRLERLTDCYVEGGLNKDTYETRKEKLLVEITEKENTRKDLESGKERILRKVNNFLELSKSLIKSYETGIFEEKRELLETVTSNLIVEGKKLVISIRSPFLEMSEMCFSNLSADDRDSIRKNQGENVNRKPFSKEQLKSLLDIIIGAVSKLPEDDTEKECFLESR